MEDRAVGREAEDLHDVRAAARRPHARGGRLCVTRLARGACSARPVGEAPCRGRERERDVVWERVQRPGRTNATARGLRRLMSRAAPMVDVRAYRRVVQISSRCSRQRLRKLIFLVRVSRLALRSRAPHGPCRPRRPHHAGAERSDSYHTETLRLTTRGTDLQRGEPNAFFYSDRVAQTAQT